VPVGIWDYAEYENLQRAEQDLLGSTFACHLTAPLPPQERSLCLGWLADQKRRGCPSIRLRVLLARRPELREVLEAVDAEDPDLYSSIEEMCAANRGQDFPAADPVAQKLEAQLGRARATRKEGLP
jgi:predicted component of type VI protein secretion system